MSRAGVAMPANAALGSALVLIASTPNYFGVRVRSIRIRHGTDGFAQEGR